MTNKKRILLTGGAGYIGSHTLYLLLEKGQYEVISVDNFSTSREYTYALIKEISGQSFHTIQADLKNYSSLKKKIKPFLPIYGVIHFAAYKSVPESVANPLKYYENNLSGLIHLLKLCEECAIRHFVFSSSCSVYGNITPEQLPVSENTPLNPPASPYAHSKKIGEDLIREYVLTRQKMKAISLRYFNPAGAHPSGKLGEWPKSKAENLIPVITETAAGLREKMYIYGYDYNTPDGTCIRDYVHVMDIAEAHILALQYMEAQSSPYLYDLFNLGTGNGISVMQAIHAFQQLTGIKINYEFRPRRTGDVEAIYSNCEKAEKMLQWKIRYTLEEMLSSAWKWQQYVNKLKTQP